MHVPTVAQIRPTLGPNRDRLIVVCEGVLVVFLSLVTDTAPVVGIAVVRLERDCFRAVRNRSIKLLLASKNSRSIQVVLFIERICLGVPLKVRQDLGVGALIAYQKPAKPRLRLVFCPLGFIHFRKAVRKLLARVGELTQEALEVVTSRVGFIGI